MLFYKVCADAVKAKQSTADYGRRLCLFAHQTSRPSDLESGVGVMCEVGYLCANFSLPRPLRSQLRPDVRDRQTDRRQTSDAHHRLMPPPYGGGGIIMHRGCTRWLDKNRFWQTRSDRPLHEQYHMGHVIPLLDRLLYDVLLEFNPCLNQLLPKLKQKISMNTCSNVDWSHTNERIDSSFN